MLLEANVTVGCVIALISGPSEVRIVRSVVSAIDSCWRLMVVAMTWLVHGALLNHGLLERTLSDRLCVGNVALGS